MKGSLIILLFFALGVGCGHFHLLPANIDFSQASYAVLCALITCVGFSVGTDRETLRRFRSLSPSLALLPFCSILGTLAGSLCAWLLIGVHPLKDAMLGSVALLSNVVREVIVLLGAPLLVRLFGSLAPIAAAGATAMDTTLPIISRACGSQYAPVSIYSGMASDFSVPFLVTFFCLV